MILQNTIMINAWQSLTNTIYPSQTPIYLNMGFNLYRENDLLDTIINDRQDIFNLFLKAVDLSEKMQHSINLGVLLYNLSGLYRITGTEEGKRKRLETALRAIDYGKPRKSGLRLWWEHTAS